VTALSLEMGPGGAPFVLGAKPTVSIDGQALDAAAPMSDRSWSVHFRKSGGSWSVVDSNHAPGLHKRSGLQGPVDDAFLDSFIFVTPSGEPTAPGTAEWAAREQERAIREWRRQFRGDAQVRRDAEISDEDIASSNLILWGDPGSNKILARIADRLPVRWTADAIVLGGESYPAATHAPILIYPNPLNPERYVVLNSGFTYREFDYLNNARQTPKLPDYAVVDVSTPPDEHLPGKIVRAGFFDEDWGL
jgi:hypothetical protein